MHAREQQKRIIANLAVTTVVAVITVCVNLIVAVLIGIAIASGLFVVRMGRSIVKRKYFGDQIHSKKVRSIKNNILLKERGKGIIVREGDTDRNLFFPTKESVSVRIHLPESERNKRLITYSPGVTFGEIAFLDGNPRSADVWSDEDSETYLLSPDEYAVLQNETPEIAVKLVRNIALDMSERLRIRTDEVRVLEEG